MKLCDAESISALWLALEPGWCCGSSVYQKNCRLPTRLDALRLYGFHSFVAAINAEICVDRATS